MSEDDLESGFECVDVAAGEEAFYQAVVDGRVGVAYAGQHPGVDVVCEGGVGVVHYAAVYAGFAVGGICVVVA